MFLTVKEAEAQRNKEFQSINDFIAKQRKRRRAFRRKMKRHEATIGLHSQNVMGFAKAEDNLQRWFSHFRQKDALGCLDLVLLQETHVEPHEIPGMTAKHSRNWGFDPLHQDGTFSYWSAASGRKGGVAILCSPYSQVQQMRPYLQAHWNSHWMAVTAEMYGETVLIVNIYAPHERPLREQFFNYLLSLQIRHHGPILCGGDFNCTLNAEADRSLQRTATYHDSLGLRRLLQEWSAVDVLQREVDEALDSRDRSSFYQSYHTYHYSLASGETGSSRLDRWYVSAEHDRWVRCVSQAVPGPYSDHDGVSLRVAAPHNVVRVKKQRRVYPVPVHVRDLAGRYTSSLFTSLRTELDEILALPETEKEKAVRAAQWWDQAKHRFLLAYVNAKKECDIKLRNSYKQRLRRLNAIMREAASATKDHRGVRNDEAIPAQEMAKESLHVIRRRIAECRQSWAEAKAQRLRRAHTLHPLRSSRDFFRRIATKFGDNTVYSLGPTPAGSPRALADQMADGWMGLMQQPSENSENIKSYLDTVVPPASATDLSPLDTRITTTEITEAIKRCKRGKAQGPDELNND
jgi:exonuclease III